MRVVLKPDDPLIARRRESLAERLRAEGFDVDLERPEDRRKWWNDIVGLFLGIPLMRREDRGEPRSEIAGLTLGIFVTRLVDEVLDDVDVYPKLKRALREWFVEEPAMDRPLKARLYDQAEGRLVEEIILPDD
jgi:hypothetical protein